jgi:hypothetical protein
VANIAGNSNISRGIVIIDTTRLTDSFHPKRIIFVKYIKMELVLKKFDTGIELTTPLRNVVLQMRIEIKTTLPPDGVRATPNIGLFAREANEHGTSFGHVGYLPNNTFVMFIDSIRTLSAFFWAANVFRHLNQFFTNNTGSRYMCVIPINAEPRFLNVIVGMLSTHDVLTITFKDGPVILTRDFETQVAGNRLICTTSVKSFELFHKIRFLAILRTNQRIPPLLRDIRIAEIQSAIDALRVEMSHGYYPAPSAARVVARQNQARANDQRRVTDALARHATPDNNDDPNVPECPLCCEKILDERPIQFKNGDTEQVYHAKCAFQAAIEHKVQKYPYQQTRMSKRNIDQVLESPALRQWQTSRATRTLAGASSSSTPSTSTPPP